jgi:hypothetical protein
MKTMLKTLAVMLTMVSSAGVANAIDLRNEDDVSYEVTVISSSMSTDVHARPMTLNYVVCVGVCEFEIGGVGKVKAQRQDIVTIKDGKITITSGEAAFKPAEALR